jgi:hypothetical protein
MHHLPRLTLWTLFACAAPQLVLAQDGKPGRPIELGMDAAITRETSDFTSSTAFRLPVGTLRIGFFASDASSIEPSVSFAAASNTLKNTQSGAERNQKGASYDVDLGLLYHFRPDRHQSQPYIRPFVGIRGFTSSGDGDFGDASGTQTSFGAGIGWKAPLADRLGGRVELGYRHDSDNSPEFFSSNAVFLSFGLSFFTR